MKKSFIIVLIAISLVSCSRNQEEKNCCKQNDSCKNDYMQLAVLYQQQSAEYSALCYQAYQLAEKNLDNILKSPKSNKPAAVIVDIDETVLDNSQYQAKCILEKISYPQSWEEWCLKEQAPSVPGAVEFLKYATSKGVTVFYVSNRKKEVLNATIQNLKKNGFPFAEEKYIYLSEGTNNKEGRRQEIAKNYNIVMLVGDNLNDFFELTEKQEPKKRTQIVDSLKSMFGVEYIMLPNPMYGDWENAIYSYNHKQTPEQKDSLRKSNLRGF